MPVTRDPDFPGEIAQLVQAFNRCADGYTMEHVLEAAANMLSAAVHNYASEHGYSDDDAMNFARNTLRGVFVNIELNWKRERQPTDVEVKAQ